MNANDNRPFPPIQLLIPICPTVDGDGMRLAWLHGFCLLNYRAVGAGLRVDGEIRIGERYGENLDLIRDLANALDRGAVLAGYDLTSIISGIGRLPIESNDPQPALDVLAKLKAMLELHDPIDLAIDDNSQTEVTLQLLRHQLGNDADDADDDELFEIGLLDEQVSLNPDRIAADLVETAGAYMLALGEMYLAEKLRPALVDAVEQWQRGVQPQLPPLALDHGNGGEPMIID